MPSWFFWWRHPCILRECIVSLKSGNGIRGLLWQSRGRWLILRQPVALKHGMPPTPMDGEAVIHRSEVDFIQVLA